MAQSPRQVSTFRKGMVVDVEPHFQPPDSYRYSRNGMLGGSNEKEGSSYAWQPAKGTYRAMSLPNGYFCVGMQEVDTGILILSTNGTNSEIGLAKLVASPEATDSFVYATLFNDRYDLHADKLNFKRDKVYKIEFVKDAENKRLVFFNTEGEELWCANLAAFYNPDGTTIHSTFSSAYPNWFSVHSMQFQMDVIFPDIIFLRRLDHSMEVSDPTWFGQEGSLKTGSYRYAVRYVSKTGYRSPWSYISHPYPVTSYPFDAYAESNHHRRPMAPSGRGTRFGQEIQLTGVDTRWWKIEVAYIYQQTDTVVEEARVFFEKELDTDSANPVIQHLSNTGKLITVDDLQSFTQSIASVNDFATHKSKLFLGGVNLINDISVDISRVSLVPQVRQLLQDVTIQPNFAETPRPGFLNARKDNDPLTNSFPQTTFFQLSKYRAENGGRLYKFLPITKDYYNYHGVQVHAELSGYFRGETYPFFLTPIDRKGNPLPSVLLGYYHTPELYEGDGAEYNLTTLGATSNRYEANILGLMVDGLRLRHSEIVDSDGKFKISGFMITRGERSGKILHQGVLVPAVANKVNDTPPTELFPNPGWMNDFQDPYVGGSGLPGSHFVKNTPGNAYIDGPTGSFPNWFYYHSPDVLVEGEEGFKTLDPSDEIKVVSTISNYGPAEVMTLVGENHSYYNKLYRSSILVGSNQYGRPEMGAISRIGFSKYRPQNYEDLAKFDPERPDLKAKYSFQAQVPEINTTPMNALNASIEPGSVLLKLPDIESADMATAAGTRSAYHVVNYLQAVPDKTADTVSTPIPSYFTGHWQPINQGILDSLPSELSNDGDTLYIFNDIEVFGGDCYLNMIDISRLYAKWSDNCAQTDFTVGFIAPLESKYNMAMRLGRSLAANGTFMEGSGCNSVRLWMGGGVQSRQPEEFNINKVLIRKDIIKSYFARNPNEQGQFDRNATIYYSNTHIDGEIIDSYRTIAPLNYRTLDGSYGEVRALVAMFDNLYCLRDRAFGRLRVNDRTAFAASLGEVYTGNGKDLDGIDYFTKTRGLQQRTAVVVMNNGMYWIDGIKGILCRFSQAGNDELSYRSEDERPLQDMTENFMVAGHSHNIFAGADPENRSIWFTIYNEDDKLSIGYHEKTDAFHGYLDVRSKVWATFGRFCLSFSDEIREVHWMFRGKRGYLFNTWYDANIEWIVNPTPAQEAKFDNLFVNIPFGEQVRLRSVQCISENTEFSLDLHEPQGTDIKKSFPLAKWQSAGFSFPLRKDPLPRLRGNYLRVNMTVSTSDQSIDGQDFPVVIPSTEVIFRPTKP